MHPPSQQRMADQPIGGDIQPRPHDNSSISSSRAEPDVQLSRGMLAARPARSRAPVAVNPPGSKQRYSSRQNVGWVDPRQRVQPSRTIGPWRHAVGSVVENVDNLAEPAGRLSQSTTLRGCYVPALAKGSIAWLLCLPVGQALPLASIYRSTLFFFRRGTNGSNPFPSTEESANFRSLSQGTTTMKSLCLASLLTIAVVQ
jgi:hypothetical protein